MCIHMKKLSQINLLYHSIGVTFAMIQLSWTIFFAAFFQHDAPSHTVSFTLTFSK